MARNRYMAKQQYNNLTNNPIGEKQMTTTTIHKVAGSTGGNQYGAYKVRHASSKQVMFIKTLLSQKAHDIKDVDFDNLNVQGAGELITKLMALPLKEGYVLPPSTRQVYFAKKLVQDKEGGLELLNKYLKDDKVNSLEDLSRESISAIISNLITKNETPLKITDVGAYLYNDIVYSIRIGNESKKWQVWSYDDRQRKYLRNDTLLPILKELTPDNRLTLEQAISRSVQTGVCCHCGRTLTQLKSVAGGIGPICAKKYH